MNGTGRAGVTLGSQSTQLGAYHVRRGFVQKTANKVVYSDGQRLLFAYPFLDVAALMDLLYISRSSAVRPTLHSKVHHNVTTSFSQYLWSSSVCILTISFVFHCLFGIVGPTFPSSINFFNGWFRLHVRNYLFCLSNKVPDLTTAMDWFVVCYVHGTQNISRYHLFSNAFMRFSMFLFRVHVSRPFGS